MSSLRLFRSFFVAVITWYKHRLGRVVRLYLLAEFGVI